MNTRTIKYTQTTIDKIMASLRAGNFRCTASKVAGISFKTFKVWMKKYPNFAAAVEKAEADCEANAIGKITDYDEHKDLRYLCWWLERKNRKWNAGVYRWELQILQRQLKELKNVIRELTENAPGSGKSEITSPELPTEKEITDIDPSKYR